MKTMLRRVGFAFLLGTMAVADNALATTYYVSPTGGSRWPFTSWDSAATNIQDAVNTAVNGDTVLIADGHYMLPGTVVVNGKNITVQSVNGAASSIIDGGYPARSNLCLSIQNVTNAIFQGFTIANGYGSSQGGGVYFNGGGTIENCVLSSNHGGYSQGGALYAYRNAALYLNVVSCTFVSNTSLQTYGILYVDSCNVAQCFLYNNTGPNIICSYDGSWFVNCLAYNNIGTAIYGSFTLDNCTVVDNYVAGNKTAGIQGGTLHNCIVWGNTNDLGAANYVGSSMFYSSCTTPQVPDSQGTLNFTLDPLFVNAATNDFRLQPGSQCINTGTNQAWMTNAVDLAGAPRIQNGIVDRGCYESSSVPLPVNAIQVGIGPAVQVSWNSEPNVYYKVQHSSNLKNSNAWQNVDGKYGNGGQISSFFATAGTTSNFYRVIVSP